MEALELLPLFFRLFRCPDKALRRLLFRHIIAGVLLRPQATRRAENTAQELHQQLNLLKGEGCCSVVLLPQCAGHGQS